MPLNAANVLTLARIVMVPVMVLLLLGDQLGPSFAAAAVFGVAALTDVADGHLARSRNMITKFGRLVDPVADKLLVGAALATLVATDHLAMWIFVVVVAREIAVSLLRWYAAGRGVEIHVSSIGKLKTGLQMTAIVALMLAPDPGAAWLDAYLLAMVAATVLSGIDYGMGYLRGAASAPAGAVSARG